MKPSFLSQEASQRAREKVVTLSGLSPFCV